MIRRLLGALGILITEPDRSPWPPSPRRPEPPDPSPAQLAEVQSLCSQWLVMWCWYRREYAAIARFGPDSTIIYDRDPRHLVFRCRAAELAVPVP
ncbi:hypothetical protein [Actinoallomurus soli]|uniref:hypothetical protein n=1 Tax=Actinoallomurus soli TaxID=2952535 RepID=UPI002093333F|nr:hypothetical protein [Actinoallomurus soli]MCO5968369.1 hypothetical protein [Actinoallomurus soli]